MPALERNRNTGMSILVKSGLPRADVDLPVARRRIRESCTAEGHVGNVWQCSSSLLACGCLWRPVAGRPPAGPGERYGLFADKSFVY